MLCKLILPPGSIGVTFKGRPATVKGTTETSPLADLVKEGQAVTQLIIPNEVSITGPVDTGTLVKILKAYSDVEGRVLRVDDSQQFDVNSSREAVWRVALPTGTIGVSFKGIPPSTSKILDDSPIAHKLAMDLQVHELIIPNVGEFTDLNSMDMGNLLNKTSTIEGRVLVLKPNFTPPAGGGGTTTVASEPQE